MSDLVLLSPELLVARVTSRQRPSAESTNWRTVQRHYVVDPEGGASLGGFEASHSLLGAGHGRAVLYEEAPYPRFVVVEVR